MSVSIRCAFSYVDDVKYQRQEGWVKRARGKKKCRTKTRNNDDAGIILHQKEIDGLVCTQTDKFDGCHASIHHSSSYHCINIVNISSGKISTWNDMHDNSQPRKRKKEKICAVAIERSRCINWSSSDGYLLPANCHRFETAGEDRRKHWKLKRH